MMKSESGPKRRTEPTTPGRPTYTYVCSALARRTEPTGPRAADPGSCSRPGVHCDNARQARPITHGSTRRELGIVLPARSESGTWRTTDAGQSLGRAPGRGGPGSRKHEVLRAADPIRASHWRPGPGSGVRRRRAAKVLLTS